jgi:hypothetical protein
MSVNLKYKLKNYFIKIHILTKVSIKKRKIIKKKKRNKSRANGPSKPCRIGGLLFFYLAMG